jgi:DNA polymerase III delta prime subunit
MTNPFAPAKRQRRPLRIAITGPSGSGKTEAALRMARQIVGPDGRIAAIDTENGEMLLYAGEPGIGPFDHVALRPPYESKKYLELMRFAADQKYDALVIDSLSHEWAGDGGILQRKEIADSVPGSNHWTNWKPFTEEHNRFIAALLNYPLWLLCTLRSKTEYTQEGSGKGAKIIKVGTSAITREGTDYEFSLVFDMDITHRATAVKGRGSITAAFEGKRIDFRDDRNVQAILDWQESADEVPPPPTPQQIDDLAALANDTAWTPQEAAAMLKKGSRLSTQVEMEQFIHRGIATLARRREDRAFEENAKGTATAPADAPAAVLDEKPTPEQPELLTEGAARG